jgi:hypothetical protein
MLRSSRNFYVVTIGVIISSANVLLPYFLLSSNEKLRMPELGLML